jgi:predicted O-methyltransferase YrrM
MSTKGVMSTEIWTNVDRYITDKLVPPDPALDAALATSEEAGLPAIAVAPPQGKLLHMLAKMTGAKSVLEIGTLGGYSAIWLARALPAGGRLITLEADSRHAEIATRNIAQAGLSKVVELRVGPALESLPQLAAENAGPFDLIFIDADKPNTVSYFDAALSLSRKGTLIIVDNVVRDGAVADARTLDASVKGMRRFFDRLAAEPRVEATALQTVSSKGYDGFAIAVVTGDRT